MVAEAELLTDFSNAWTLSLYPFSLLYIPFETQLPHINCHLEPTTSSIPRNFSLSFVQKTKFLILDLSVSGPISTFSLQFPSWFCLKVGTW